MSHKNSFESENCSASGEEEINTEESDENKLKCQIINNIKDIKIIESNKIIF